MNAKRRRAGCVGLVTPPRPGPYAFLGSGSADSQWLEIRGVGDTVKTHLKNLFRKLNVSDRAEAVREAIHRGFLHLD